MKRDQKPVSNAVFDRKAARVEFNNGNTTHNTGNEEDSYVYREYMDHIRDIKLHAKLQPHVYCRDKDFSKAKGLEKGKRGRGKAIVDTFGKATDSKEVKKEEN